MQKYCNTQFSRVCFCSNVCESPSCYSIVYISLQQSLLNLEMINCCVRIDHRWSRSQLNLETCDPCVCMWGGQMAFHALAVHLERADFLYHSSLELRDTAPALSTHTHQPTVPILCQTCQDTWVSGRLYRQTWGQLWQAWGNTRDQFESKFSPDLTACLFVSLTGARRITLGTIDYDSELIVASVSLDVILL